MDTANHEPKKKLTIFLELLTAMTGDYPLKHFICLVSDGGRLIWTGLCQSTMLNYLGFILDFRVKAVPVSTLILQTGKIVTVIFFISIISRVFKQMILCRAYGVLVLPLWRSAKFWPLFCCKDGYLIHTITDMTDLPLDKSSYVPCKNGKGILGYTDLKFRMLALRLDFLSVRFMNFERYFQWANITDNSEDLIFRRLELILDIFCELIISHCLIQDLGNYSLKHLSLMFWISRNLVCTASD